MKGNQEIQKENDNFGGSRLKEASLLPPHQRLAAPVLAASPKGNLGVLKKSREKAHVNGETSPKSSLSPTRIKHFEESPICGGGGGGVFFAGTLFGLGLKKSQKNSQSHFGRSPLKRRPTHSEFRRPNSLAAAKPLMPASGRTSAAKTRQPVKLAQSVDAQNYRHPILARVLLGNQRI